MNSTGKRRYLIILCVIFMTCFYTAACTTIDRERQAAGVSMNDAAIQEINDSAAANDVHEDTDIVSGYADLNHDGINEKLVVDISKVEESQEAVLKVLDAEDNVIWQESAWIPHAGWNSIYLCTVGGKDFLLRYNPYMIQGHGNYTYRLFSLDGQGTEKLINEGELDFSITGITDEFDIEKMVSFYNEINGYLDKSILLLSTEHGELEYGTLDRKITRKEEFSWLYDGTTEYDENDSLEDKLRKYKSNMK